MKKKVEFMMWIEYWLKVVKFDIKYICYCIIRKWPWTDLYVSLFSLFSSIFDGSFLKTSRRNAAKQNRQHAIGIKIVVLWLICVLALENVPVLFCLGNHIISLIHLFAYSPTFYMAELCKYIEPLTLYTEQTLQIIWFENQFFFERIPSINLTPFQ